ncbi:helix-turn-helix domain-containing protein [Candidatus Berkiella aquae]|uniref:Helix-turn-helix domain protein n=1 Tax=Candidatus Berkiella aquae TaxID=295108 RepID=A0A0Q9YM88_9GAMM|nr:helix-turn-helix transcriptional regulator [Candidatus Berkiella aquae]MCS5710432.1 helix-turn-helix domain-containing protein [Candidatus Berkiella aquae]
MTFSKNLVAKRLKEARLKAKLSQKKLGIAAGIDEFTSSARMNQYETGKHIPDLLTLKQIAKVLNVPISYFYAEDDLIAEILIYTEKMNKVNRAKLLRYIQSL